MEYRTIGKTGLRVSEIGFGCGNNAVLMVQAPYEDQVEAVRHALDCRINFFDTAYAYGLGKSEENLGRILKQLGVAPVISTKIRLEADCVTDIKAATIHAVEAGLNRLGRERVDFVQLHTRVTTARSLGKRFSLTPADVLAANGVIAGFKTMRDRGKVGFFGFSGLGDPDALLELVDSGEFHGFQCYYNLLNPSAGKPSAIVVRRARLSAHSGSRRSQWHGSFCHPSSGGRRAYDGSQHRRRGKRTDIIARIGVLGRPQTCGKGESGARSGGQRVDSSGDPFCIDQSKRFERARGVFQNEPHR